MALAFWIAGQLGSVSAGFGVAGIVFLATGAIIAQSVFFARRLRKGGEAPLRETFQERGVADFPVGPPGAPNSAWLAFIRRTSSSYEPVRMMRSNCVR